MKRGLSWLVRPILILIGFGILLYPSISEYLSQHNSSRATASYDTSVQELQQERLHALLEEARDYNRQLLESNGYEAPLTDDEGVPITEESYWDILNINGDGMMGYIHIPRLNETIPIYHGTAEEVLQVGVGHVQNTSLPVGGENTHAALSGHRGLPTASLFTDLDQVQVGDTFYIQILGETFAYQVNQILTVLPEETEALAIQPGEDYVTLITCTPYGINSHRLLVRGTRIPYIPEEAAVQQAMEEPNLWNKIPMQYRHLILGMGALAIILLLRMLFLRHKGKYLR